MIIQLKIMFVVFYDNKLFDIKTLRDDKLFFIFYKSLPRYIKYNIIIYLISSYIVCNIFIKETQKINCIIDLH